jgi:hypothetical protein
LADAIDEGAELGLRRLRIQAFAEERIDEKQPRRKRQYGQPTTTHDAQAFVFVFPATGLGRQFRLAHHIPWHKPKGVLLT